MSDLEKIEDVVSEHAVSIALMTRAVSSIESLLTQQTISIKEIEKAMKSQELLMEKLSNLDSRMNDSITRIHGRITKNEDDIALMKKEHIASCAIVTPLAEKGARIHTGMVIAAKGLAGAVGVMLLSMFVWLVQQGAHK
jgi:phage terminase large subunit-like protein